MAKEVKVGVSGAVRNVTDIKQGVSGVVKSINSGTVGISGVQRYYWGSAVSQIDKAVWVIDEYKSGHLSSTDGGSTAAYMWDRYGKSNFESDNHVLTVNTNTSYRGYLGVQLTCGCPNDASTGNCCGVLGKIYIKLKSGSKILFWDFLRSHNFENFSITISASRTIYNWPTWNTYQHFNFYNNPYSSSTATINSFVYNDTEMTDSRFEIYAGAFANSSYNEVATSNSSFYDLQIEGVNIPFEIQL